jgi:hypothetical protein
MKNSVRFALATLGLASMLALAAPPLEAQAVRWGVRGGIYTDVSEPFVGVDALTRLGATSWYFNPNVEWVLVSRGRLVTINGDFHYDLPVAGPTFVWLGGGPAVVFTRPPGRDSETDLGLNLLAGIGWRAGGLIPYFQGKVLIADNNEAVLAVGLRF